MAAFRLLLVQLIGVGTVSAQFQFSCPDLFNDKSATFNVSENVCVYMMDLNDTTFLDNLHQPSEHSVLYQELLGELQDDKMTSGRGFWSVGGTMYDVYYVAFEASTSLALNETHPELYDADIGEYLMRQYLLTSFINCIPTNLAAHEFSCYGGKLNDNGEYTREQKTANCRGWDGVYNPIEHGLDVCAFQFDFADDKYDMNVTVPTVKDYPDPEENDYVKLPRPVGEHCKLYRDGLNTSKLTGIDESMCLRRVGPHSYDILCCFYGNQIEFEEYIPKSELEKTMLHSAKEDFSSGTKSFCAVVDSATYMFDFSTGDAKRQSIADWKERPPKGTVTTWSEMIESHFHQMCISRVKYRFDGKKTVVTQTVFGLDNNRTDCYPEPRLRTTYDGEKKRTCPFEAASEVNEMEAEYCCQGYLCNHSQKDFYARHAAEDVDELGRQCHRPHTALKEFPELSRLCKRVWDSVAGKEIILGNNERTLHQSRAFRTIKAEDSESLVVAGFQSEHVLTMAVEEFEKKCPVNPPGFIERRRTGIPWMTVTYYCYHKDQEKQYDSDDGYCDGRDENFMEQFDDNSTVFSHCYDHPEGGEVVPFADRRYGVNKESVFCFMMIREDDSYNLRVTAGSYNGSTSQILFDDFHFTCALRSPGLQHTTTYKFNETLRTTVSCFYGYARDGQHRWLDALEYHSRNALLDGHQVWNEVKRSPRISCRDNTGFLKSCDSPSQEAIGCYMWRQVEKEGFEESGCLWMGEEQVHRSRTHALCEHELLHNQGNVAFCSSANESIFCCCRHDEDCQKLRTSYSRVMIE